ncbi:2,3-bisphosphoglycerate-dependent phosphoglycerate mutase [Paraburkholderia fynbosensis]|uniref:2,3-bisphosphoglycerate-dependent phosphoglycerate mutase n=1 Tax=Paraburkholderia fynbosensis TaxID=1200993 RepID=A0A6J5FD95_9BURK|nr:2,3-bisphosphoglycerate-dependent phosphoglycerate mutase [Paraburkholderia fynbosensis]CAB3777352.1 2,3-bisphosphoglycerate-dependent phosphoglycerate mutase [Paraburkholderia fynbosensis]
MENPITLTPAPLGSQTKLVLLRHGESEWNASSRFTGWADIDLTPQGMIQAQIAAKMLRHAQWTFDCGFSSILTRALRTYWVVARHLHPDRERPPVTDWRLNERHYGILTGMTKAEVSAEYGPLQLTNFRFNADARPEPVPLKHQYSPESDPRYSRFAPQSLPRGESIGDAAIRVRAAWSDLILPRVLAGNRVLVCGHGTTLRSLIQIIEGLPDEVVTRMKIPNAEPVAYG